MSSLCKLELIGDSLKRETTQGLGYGVHLVIKIKKKKMRVTLLA